MDSRGFLFQDTHKFQVCDRYVRSGGTLVVATNCDYDLKNAMHLLVGLVEDRVVGMAPGNEVFGHMAS